MDRILKLLYNTVYNNDDEISSNSNVDTLFSSLRSKIDEAVQKANNRLDYRPISCFWMNYRLLSLKYR